MIPAIISVCNLKGGSGKSTLAVNIASAITCESQRECVLVDADPQRTALTWGAAGKLPTKVVSRILQEAKPEERYPGMVWVTQIKGLAESTAHVIIDLPPGLQYSLAAVSAVSDLVLVPVNPSGIDFHSTASFISLLKKSRKVRGSPRPYCLIVPNRLDRRTTISQKLSLYEQFEEPMATPIGMRTSFAYAFDHGQWIGDYAPKSVAHREILTLLDKIANAAETGAAIATADRPARNLSELGYAGRLPDY